MTAVVIPLLVSACGSDTLNSPNTEGVNTNPSNLLMQDSLFSDSVFEPRELTVSQQKTTIYAIAQCFCYSLYRSTLQFYYFVDQKAILTIDFDNTSIDFEPNAVLYLFDQSTSDEKIAQWMNNQHSDGLYVNPARPRYSFSIDSDDITITSRAYIDQHIGFYKDEYEAYIIEFSVDTIYEEGYFLLTSFSDTSTVYLETLPPQNKID